MQDKKGKEGRLGIAFVGLGNYATNYLAPAVLQTEHCYVAGIVTGTPSKIPNWQKKYGIPDKNVYSYDTYDSIKDNPDIDIIYVVLPNNMHAEYTIRGFEAAKHMICENQWPFMWRSVTGWSLQPGKLVNICQLVTGYILNPIILKWFDAERKKIFGEIKKKPGVWFSCRAIAMEIDTKSMQAADHWWMWAFM